MYLKNYRNMEVETLILFKIMSDKKPVGRPKSGNTRKSYWTDLKTHATISKLVEARKIRSLTDEALEKLTNQIIGK